MGKDEAKKCKLVSTEHASKSTMITPLSAPESSSTIFNLFVYFFLTLILSCVSLVHSALTTKNHNSIQICLPLQFPTLLFSCSYLFLLVESFDYQNNGEKNKTKKLRKPKTAHKHQTSWTACFQVAFPLFLYSSIRIHCALLLLSVECCCSCSEFLIA